MTTRLSVDKHCTSQKPPPISVTLIEHTITKSTDAWNGHYPENGLHWPSKKKLNSMLSENIPYMVTKMIAAVWTTIAPSPAGFVVFTHLAQYQ